MHYQISRGGQIYGPYTLDDLRRYVASGNVLGSDLGKSAEMAEWVPVSQLLGEASVILPGPDLPVALEPVAIPVANPVAALASSPYPDPPNLHWVLVLVFAVIGHLFFVGLFMTIWNLVITGWLRRVQPNSNAIFFYIAVPVLAILGLVPVYFIWVADAHGNPAGDMHYGPVAGFGFVMIAVWVLRLLGRFAERAGLEEHFNTAEPLGLRLSPVMTFFFGGIYFQYHLNRIAEMKKMARFQAGMRY